MTKFYARFSITKTENQVVNLHLYKMVFKIALGYSWALLNNIKNREDMEIMEVQFTVESKTRNEKCCVKKTSNKEQSIVWSY